MLNPDWYKAVWRWHFYAGLFTLPFLVLMAATGAAYLFKDEINRAQYRDLFEVEPERSVLSPEQIVERAMADTTMELQAYMPPISPGHSARVVLRDEAGQSYLVFVNPYQGTVLGSVTRGQFGNPPLMSLVRRLHSLEIAGWLGNRIVEVVAGWLVILVVSGLYLWLPRAGRDASGAGLVKIRRNSGRRVFWRDLHAVTGAFASVFILFLALSGLPWSGFWGENLKQLINQAGWGYPAGYWFPVVQSSSPPAQTPALKDTAIAAPWTVENLPLPTSGNSVGQALGLGSVIARLETLGMPPGYAVNFPLGPSGVWSAS